MKALIAQMLNLQIVDSMVNFTNKQFVASLLRGYGLIARPRLFSSFDLHKDCVNVWNLYWLADIYI